MRRSSLSVLVLSLAACGKSHAQDAGVVPEVDGGDPCPAGSQTAGCPCEIAGEVVPCYDGPAATEGVGACTAGVRVCGPERWGPCEGQVLPIEEACNGLDDDCDGDAADDPVFPCGDCDADCSVVGWGPTEARPFDEPAATLDGAALEAGLLVRGGEHVPKDVLWTAGELYTMARVDTLAREVVGLYRPSWEASNVHPVVSAVDYAGNAYFGNRGGAEQTSVTKVLHECVDADRDGEVRTSHGMDELLDFEEDECVPWRADLSCDRGGFGGCEEVGAIAYEMRVEGGAIVERLWVGTRESTIREVDARSGEETGVVANCDCQPDGAAVDRDGFLWIQCGGSVCRVETRDPETIDRFYRSEGTSQDITVDADGFVWSAGDASRFEPGIEDWDYYANHFGHGVTSSPEAVYVGACPFGDVSGSFCRIDTVTDEIEVVSGDLRTLAVDARGLVWGFHTRTSVFDPASGVVEEALDCGGDPCILGQWHQSDMTGTQILAATDPPAVWRATAEPCPAGPPTWMRIEWEAEIPVGAAVELEVRAAQDASALATREWTPIEGPMPAPLDALGLDRNAALLEVRATLAANPGAIDPSLHSVRVHRHCE